jgi:regulator of protease activity HflC (stomatin/prohibitin superfamily)
MTKKRPPTWQERVSARLIDVQFYIYTLLLALLILATFLWPRIIITVPTGSQGVMFRTFGQGTVTERLWPEGIHIIPPWDTLTIYEVRLQHRILSFSVLSAEGLELTVKIAVRFRPNLAVLGYLHQDIGPEYFERLVRPEIEAHVRRAFGKRPVHELYSSSRGMLQELTQVPMLARRGVVTTTGSDGDLDGVPYVDVQELKLTEIELPALIEAAIAEKFRQEQLMLEYEYKLEREEREAERKRTEAAGIRDYNLIAGEVSHDLLRWRSIDATAALTSAPSKVVVLGGSNNGMQMLLDVGDDKGEAPKQGPEAPAAAKATVAEAPTVPAPPQATPPARP